MTDDLARYKERLAALQRRRDEEARKKAEAGEAAPPAEEAAAAPTAAAPAATGPEPPIAKAVSDEKSVFIGSLDWSVKREQLEGYFKACGNITRLTILTDPHTHKPKGSAYIEFAELDGVENALMLDNHLFAGRNIQVKRKKSKPPGFRSRSRFRRF
jgi:RNA recognition motif-containing protein